MGFLDCASFYEPSNYHGTGKSNGIGHLERVFRRCDSSCVSLGALDVARHNRKVCRSKVSLHCASSCAASNCLLIDMKNYTHCT